MFFDKNIVKSAKILSHLIGLSYLQYCKVLYSDYLCKLQPNCKQHFRNNQTPKTEININIHKKTTKLKPICQNNNSIIYYLYSFILFWKLILFLNLSILFI